MANLRIERLSKSYGPTLVLDDINLSADDREFVVLVGPSGCGKSTLLRMIAGLDAPTAGDIYIGDRLVNALAPAERKIAMVFQSYALYPHMNVRKNMTFGLKFSGVGRVETRSAASRFDSGSSNKNTSGSRTIARPIATRWRCPPERSRG